MPGMAWLNAFGTGSNYRDLTPESGYSGVGGGAVRPSEVDVSKLKRRHTTREYGDRWFGLDKPNIIDRDPVFNEDEPARKEE